MGRFSLQQADIKPHKDYWEFDDGARPEQVQSLIETGGDFHTNKVFINKIYSWFNKTPLNILDIGCGGAALVEDFVKDGHNGIGLDANYNYRDHNVSAWGRIPDNLFVCDVGQKFHICETTNYTHLVMFDLVTSWELLEHIRPDDINAVMENIRRHTRVGAYFAGSASEDSDYKVHRLIRGMDWWTAKFSEFGFKPDDSFRKHVGRNYVRNCPKSTYYFMRRTE